MKNLVLSTLLLFTSVVAFAQSEGVVGDTSTASRPTRYKFEVTPAKVPVLRVGSQPLIRLALYSEMIAAAGGGIQTVNGVSPTNGAVVVTTNQVAEGTTNKYASSTNVRAVTDPLYASLTGSYSNPSWVTSLGFNKLTGTPTTVSGYGITDAVSTAGTYTNPNWLVSIPFSKISSPPTTAAGYGISDAVTTGGSYSNPTWLTNLSWSKVLSTPTTLAGYGITDAASSSALSAKANSANTLYTDYVASYAAMTNYSVPSGSTYLLIVASDEKYGGSNGSSQLYIKTGSGVTFKVQQINESN